MKQHRDLVPVTIYLPPDAKLLAETRADALSIATATLLRMIVLGAAPPLKG